MGLYYDDQSGRYRPHAITRQYQMIESIVTSLRAKDLLALALTSKSLYESIFTAPSSLENLLGRVQCSGRGIEIRKERHKKSSFFYSYNCTQYVQCGSNTTHRDVETKPCVTCKVATCNECRIHCVYQSIYEPPSDPDDGAELPNFSGFVLLQPLEQPILSPHHLISETSSTVPRWQDPSEGPSAPYHDQGYLDVPLETGASAPPECIEDVLDLDLGCQSLVSMSGDSRYAAPSPVLLSLCQVTEARKVEICTSCMEIGAIHSLQAMQSNAAARPPADKTADQPCSRPTTACHCTLRSRILDRWLCLRCYSAEESTFRALARNANSDSGGVCHCGELSSHSLCLWCHGTISEGAIL
jgi:hypothetical protein